MKRSYLSWIALAALTAMTASCVDETPAINRVGVNVVDKGLFTGSWYYSRVVIDVDYEAAGIGTYPGDAAIDFVGSDLGVMPRVRWVIDEDMIYAYRDYELFEGINGEDAAEATPGESVTHPVAAFAIDSHFDIRRDYNAQTGEERNVLVENTSDRRWYERDYMRVDWSKNHLPGYYGQIANLYEVIGFYNREPADLFIQGSSDFPDSWRPQFHFMPCAGLDDTSEGCSEGERDWAADYEQGELYHFSFVTQELLSPGNVPDPFTGAPINWCISPYADAPNCVTTAVYVRNSFLKVSDSREYVAQNWNDTRFERAGYFRLERNTYDRSSAADDPAFGQTDFLNYSANRQNIWYDWVDDAGNPVPYADRRVRQVVWYTTPELPAHLVEPSYDLVSRWNEVYMRLVRNLRGEPLPEYPEVSCQTENPDGYCYCITDPDTGDVLNPTCAGGYDPFVPPSESTATNPFDCHVEVPDGARPDLNAPDLGDEDFYQWFNARMVGSECVVVLRPNTCNRLSIDENGGTTDGMECQERGDLRYKYLSYVDQPGTAFLGVATLRGDPVTGELITGDANIGGPALDGYRTSALQAYDLINGRITDRDFLIGEDVRSYLENLNNIENPAPPREDFSVATRAPELVDDSMIRNQMERFAQRAQRLAGPEGRANTFSDRRRTLAGTDIERRLMANRETLMMAGLDVLPEGRGVDDINENILDRVSPFRTSAFDQLRYQNEMETRIGKANVMMPNEFVDNSVLEFVNRHRDWPRARLEIALNQLLYYQTQLHEMGHCLGLRHSFAASADVDQYDPNYYLIDERIPLPDPADFDTDGTNGLSADEIQAFEDAYDAAKERRELAGIDRFMDSSIMEYTAQWYQRATGGSQGVGSYDNMAISFAYADVVEVYDNTSTGNSLDDINPANTPRVWAKWYQGGQDCNVDADCPYAAGGAMAGELLPANMSTGLTQTCQPHPNGGAFGNICSNFDQDARAMLEGAGEAPPYVPVEYAFCTDDRVGTDAKCHRFDEGDSYREIVRNLTEQYDRQYIFTNFRRYRAGFSLGGYLFNRLIGRQFNILQSMFQDLLFRYQQDPEYRNTTGPFGFNDHFMATADTLNFYGKILAQPGIGAYRFDEGWQRYERYNNDADTPGAQLALPLGMARYPSSEYQAGLTGIQRIELIGTFYEKWFTMQMLTERGYTSSYTRDVPFWTNYYDLFPVELQQMFQGMILEEPEALAPRLECGSGEFPRCNDPRLVYMDFYRGDCSEPGTCRPSPEENFEGLPIVNSGTNVTLSFLGAALSLSEFPVFWDTAFQNQLFVCVEGNGACFEPSASDVEYEVGVTTIEEADYVRFFSERYGKSFIAWQVEPSVNVPNQQSIGFEMVRRAEETQFLFEAVRTYRGDFGGDALSTDNLTPDQQDRIAELGYTLPGSEARADDEIERLDRWLRDQESFFFQLVQLQQQYGVRSYLGF